MKAELEKFKRHIRKAIPFKFKNEKGEEDTFYFKPLTMEQLMTFTLLSEKVDPNTQMPNWDKEDLKELANVLVGVVKESYPDLEDDIANDFVANHFTEMMEMIQKLMPKNAEIDTNKLKEFKQKYQNENKG